ncbi:hypothetical protein NDN08_002048 [Rhodosorus marinus]|uniref:Uncharacterized protein n=1 Tax=Rhodosorus marinus TaxID=101924 RepID=A0AAV8USM2_9RHOD|nr:hypothetical protein NDN08_002048 [Rhodosorus marinus]
MIRMLSLRAFLAVGLVAGFAYAGETGFQEAAFDYELEDAGIAVDYESINWAANELSDGSGDRSAWDFEGLIDKYGPDYFTDNPPPGSFQGEYDRYSGDYEGDYGYDSDGLSGGAIAGIVIGSVVGAALLAGLMIFALKRKRRRRRGEEKTDAETEEDAENLEADHGGEFKAYYDRSGQCTCCCC